MSLLQQELLVDYELLELQWEPEVAGATKKERVESFKIMAFMMISSEHRAKGRTPWNDAACKPKKWALPQEGTGAHSLPH